MDYTQLTDDELRRKVLELMGYSLNKDTHDPTGCFLTVNGQYVSGSLCFNENEELSINLAWQQAPDPLNDANVYMGLVDEIGKFGYSVSIHATYQRFVSAYLGTTRLIYSRNQNIGRAVCEVYCQVKEQ